MTSSARSPTPQFLIALAVLLALFHAVLAVTATANKSMTADEIAHLTAGDTYNTRNDYRLQPENGNLPQRLAALPLTLSRAALPPTSLESWRTADVWNYGHTFFYGGALSSDEMLFLGRAMIALVSAATGLLVFFWSRALFGWRGAFLSLALYVFCPTFLAHGALATSDVTMTFFFLASVGAWWRHLQRPGWKWATISAVTLGIAFVAKFSAVLLPPILALIALVWAVEQRGVTGWQDVVRRLGRTSLLHAIVTWLVIWMFYGFRYSAFAPSLANGATFNHGWEWILNDGGFPVRFASRLNDLRLLPEAWLYGLTFVLQFSRARAAFMNGDYSVTGWLTFFPFAFLVKTTLPLLALVAIGVVSATRKMWKETIAAGAAVAWRRVRPLTPLAALFIVYWATSLTSHLNIGHRHILPTYPVLLIAIGWLGRAFDFRRPFAPLLISALVVWHAAESFIIRPHYLAYFNEIVGPENGWRHLVDSSLDWGQDLPGLKTWLDRHAQREKVYLAYFGTGDPAYEGIHAVALPTLPWVGSEKKWQALGPGIYALSATMLQHAYSNFRGDWTAEREREFQEWRAMEPLLLDYQANPTRRAALLRDAPAEKWMSAWKRYEQLRFARLCHYLRVRGPDAEIGYSILIFRLTPEEISGAAGGSIQSWRDLIERTVASRGVGN